MTPPFPVPQGTKHRDKAANKEQLTQLVDSLAVKMSVKTDCTKISAQQFLQTYLPESDVRIEINMVILQVLLVVGLTVLPSSSLFHKHQPSKWCSTFPDEEAREKCHNTTGSFWMNSPSCCNVKFECVEGEYSQGLRCKESGYIPDENATTCIKDSTCIGDSTTQAPTTTRSTTTTPSSSTPTTTGISVSPSACFCSSFPTSEPQIYCAYTSGSFWMPSPSCCNVKFECVDGGYNQGFRCSSPGFVPDVSELKCIEDSRCAQYRYQTSSEEQSADMSPKMICSSASAQYMPHPSDCSKYMYCDEGVVTLLQCPSGSIFLREYQHCSPGSKESCELLDE